MIPPTNTERAMTTTLTNEQICSAFGLPAYDEWVQQRDTDVFDWAVDIVRDRDGIEIDFEFDDHQARVDATCAYIWERITRDYDLATRDALDGIEAHYGIEFRPVEGSFDKEFELSIHDPEETAAALVEVINGYGLFHFGSVEELISSGPYADATDAVLKHLHWIAEHGKVYGESSPRGVWDRSFERSSRRW
jgi:hypothetical protein